MVSYTLRIADSADELEALPIGVIVRCDDDEGIGLNVAERKPHGWIHVGSDVPYSSKQLACDGLPLEVVWTPEPIARKEEAWHAEE